MRIRAGFFWKLYAGFGGLILVTAALVGWRVEGRMEEDARRETEAMLLTAARLLRDLSAPHLDPPVSPSFEEQIRRLGRETACRLTVIRADGVPVADSDEDPARMDNHGQRPEILALRAADWGTSVRFSHTVNEEMMYVAVSIVDRTAPAGFARAAVSMARFHARVDYLRRGAVLATGLAALLALGVAFFLGRRVTQPLAEMTDAAGAIARGEPHAPLAVQRTDEIGRLARAFQEMSDQLRDRMDSVVQERNRLQGILTGMVEGVVAVDREERVVHLNAVAARLLQAGPAESVGRRLWEATGVAEVIHLVGVVHQSGEARKQEVRIAGPSGSIDLDLHAAPLHDAAGAVTGVVLVLHDVTELRRLEAVRRDFIANVSHELKTPVTAIRGFAETMLDEPGMNPETRTRFLGRLRDQASRLSSLVSDFLTLSRLESRDAALESRRLDLRHPVEESVRDLRPAAQAKGLRLDLSVPDATAEVMGDAEMLRQLVDNLLNNAIKYTSEGGSVSVGLTVDPEQACLTVKDSGIGIEPRHLDRIFERFYRVDKARSRELGGTGLGLSIVRHIALVHHGEVGIESIPGVGSTFRFRLPRLC